MMRFPPPTTAARILSRPISKQSHLLRQRHLQLVAGRRLPSTLLYDVRSFGSTRDLSSASNNNNRSNSIIPGVTSTSPYGSLGEPLPSSSPAVAWQATHNVDVQRVTQNAMIYELQQSQTKTIETVVPWFLSQMPASYFRQVPDHLRYDHIKAIAAVQDANMVRSNRIFSIRITLIDLSILIKCHLVTATAINIVTGSLFEFKITYS